MVDCSIIELRSGNPPGARRLSLKRQKCDSAVYPFEAKNVYAHAGTLLTSVWALANG